MTAAEAATQVCRNLAAEVAGIAPNGIGHWAGAWDIVADADFELVQTLGTWEFEPSDEGQARVRATYNAVLAAWRRAVAQWQKPHEGRREAAEL